MKTIIITSVITALTIVLTYQVYVNYQFRKAWSDDHAVLGQIVNIINSQPAK